MAAIATSMRAAQALRPAVASTSYAPACRPRGRTGRLCKSLAPASAPCRIARMAARGDVRCNMLGLGFGGGYSVTETTEVAEEVDYTVAKLQVGVFGKVEDFKQRLDRIAQLCDTDDVDALREMVTELSMLLYRNVEYCAYASTGVFMTQDIQECESKFNQTSMQERAKFKGETLTNYGGRKRADSLGGSGGADEVGLDQWLCITLLIAIEGRQMPLPRIEGMKDLQESLSLLGGLGVDELIAAEVLWTPQEEGDAYSKEELLADYPKLMNV